MKHLLSLAGSTVGTLLLVQSTAHAHIDMLAPLVGRQGDQKARPCEGASRGPVYTFEPGALITLGVDEGIAHDSYFRIAFDDDGTDGFKDPASIDPINPRRDADSVITNLSGGTGTGGKCINNPADKCGKSDFCNVVSKDGKATVLWDNLDPHLASAAKNLSWTVKLPNVECNNCTLQIIQVMEDIGGHGPYDGTSDLYYRCVDIVLKKGAGTSGPGNATGAISNKGIDCLATGGADGPADAGVSTDASVVPSIDAGTARDAGSVPPSTGGGTLAAGGATSGVGSPGGSLSGTGGTGTAGGTTSGTGAATGSSGTVVDAGTMTPAATGGTGTATNPAVVAGANDDDGGCSVAVGGGRDATQTIGLVGILMMILVERRRQRAQA